jgi:P4 family phage/plasmid primase-like protien
MTGPYEHAKQYRKLGWRGTLPLPEGKKEAPPEGYHGHGAPYPSDMEVRKWIKGNPNGNICLRLADVDYALLREGLPSVYGGNIVDGWELIGIDVDDYGPKNGYKQLLALEEQLGKLPATIVSSARWETAPMSGTRLFLVPKGFRYKGKAAATGHEGPKHIDVLYAGLRYLVVWPSTNPHADGALYRFRYGVPGEGELTEYDGIPHLLDVDVLPVTWFQHLLQGVGSDADDASELDFGDLNDWAADTFRDVQGEPCRLMANDTEKYKDELDDSDHHHPLNDVVWRLTRNALEGHSGWHTALTDYLNYWWDLSKDSRNLDEMQGEIGRTLEGALAKVKAEHDKRGGFFPEDKCDGGHGDPDAWAKKFDEDTKRIADGDNDGFGPVVGRMEFAQAKPSDEYGQHDDGNAQHFIDVVGDNAKYVDGRDSWVVWDGERWHRDLNGRFVRLAYRKVRLNQERFAKQLASEARQNDDKAMAKKAATWAQWSKRSGNLAPIKTALESSEALYVGTEPVAIQATKFDSSPNLLGCANGILELTADPEIREPRKDDYVTFNTGTPYVPWRTLVNEEGAAFEGYDLWTEYLEMFLPDPKVREYVQKVLGHMIVGENPEKRIVFLYGPHDTGKSTMLGAIQGALGDYFGTVDISLFKQKDLNPGLIRAVPLRITAMSEVDAGTMDVSMVKKLTGNDTVMAEAKYSNEIFQGRPQFTTVVACNNPPDIKHADEALEERLLVLPFSTTISRVHRRYDRQTQIERHSGVAVLSWLVEGWKAYCREGLGNPPREVRAVQRDMVSGLNATQTFISECLDKATDTEEGRRVLETAKRIALEKGYPKPKVQHLPKEWTAPAGVVYEIYCRWCSANGVQAGTHPDLTKDIGVKRPDVRKLDGKPTRCYYGIRIKPNMEQRGTGWRAK